MRMRSNDGEAKPLLILVVIILGLWLLHNQVPLASPSPLVYYGAGLIGIWGGIVASQSFRSPLTGTLSGFILYIIMLYITMGITW